MNTLPRIRLVVSLCLLAIALPNGIASATLVYTLSDPGLPNGYGFSGTITTDGSLGNFSTSAPIIDWTITLLTPAGVDGVASQVITPSNSTLADTLSFSPGLLLTPTTMELPPTGVLLTANSIGFNTPASAEVLQFSGGDGVLNIVPAIQMVDVSETPAFESFIAGGPTDTMIVATVIPEPGGLLLACSALLSLGLRTRRQPRNSSNFPWSRS